MMIFKNNASSYNTKVNFVDINNVFVGFDTDQSCCEDAGWYITDSIIPYSYDKPENTQQPLEEYVFDEDFFQEVHSENLDSGGMVVFKLVADGKPPIYLHLYNAHNGYYSHGFEVKHSGTIVKEGNL